MDSTEFSQTKSSLIPRLKEELEDLSNRNLRRRILTPESGQKEKIVLEGDTLLNFTSNNYLGLATDPALIRASIEATETYGTSVAASRLLVGSTPLHDQLEESIAALKKCSSALLYSAGYLANIGVISALTSPGDIIFSDSLNHASIIDGTRLSRAETVVYRHLDLEHLDQLLSAAGAKQKFVVTETVFSMDGDLVDLPKLHAIVKKHGAVLIVDEAHATGVLGESGGGAFDYFSIDPAETVIVGTFSKALGSIGGFVTGPSTVIEYLKNRSRSFIFNTALPPSAVGAALVALEKVVSEPDRRSQLIKLSEYLRSGLVEAGFSVSNSQTQIVPMIIGEAVQALFAEKHLRNSGVLAKAIRPPTVPEGTSRIRFNLNAKFDKEDIDKVLDAVRNWSFGGEHE